MYVASADGEDGPFVFARNVIVNDSLGVPEGSHIDHREVSDTSRITIDDDLVGGTADGLVDEEGRLTDAYESYRGTHGYELP